MIHRFRWTAVRTLLYCSILCSQAQAQQASEPRMGSLAQWSVVDALGYAGLGIAAGYGVVSATKGPGEIGVGSSDVPVIVGSGVLGALLGKAIGGAARSRIEEGQPLTDTHRRAVFLGAILAGGALGGAASYALIQPEGEGTSLGSDELTTGLLVGSGLTLGAIYVARHRHDFDIGRVSVAPYRARQSGYGLRVDVRM